MSWCEFVLGMENRMGRAENSRARSQRKSAYGRPVMLGLTSPCQEPIAIHGNEKSNQLQPRNYRTTKCCTADYEGLLDTQPTTGELSIGQVDKWLLEFITSGVGKLMMRQNERLLNRQYVNWLCTLPRGHGFFILLAPPFCPSTCDVRRRGLGPLSCACRCAANRTTDQADPRSRGTRSRPQIMQLRPEMCLPQGPHAIG
jgi:hypothetical protein